MRLSGDITARVWRIAVAMLVGIALLAVPEADAQTRRKGRAKGRPAAAAQAPAKQSASAKKKAPAKAAPKTSDKREIDNIRQKKSETEKQISQTAGELDRTGKELNRRLNQLNSLNADISTSKARVDSLRSHLVGLGNSINSAADSIRICEAQLEQLRRAYVDAMQRLQPYADRTGTLAFIFSSSSFVEAYRRIRYVRQFAAWRQAKADAITAAIDDISARRQHLTSLRHEQDVAFRQAEAGRRQLESQQAESARLVESLRRNEAEVRKNLALQRKQAAALDSQLDRLIESQQKRMAEQQKRDDEQRRRDEQKRLAGAKKPTLADNRPAPSKPAPKDEKVVSPTASAEYASLTGSFAQNKGRMPFPVEGSYKIVRRFGRQPHPTLPNVETENSGIDIETRAGARVRAVFSGVVSAIFKQDGFNSIVMLRHGSYITVYAGLGSVSVKTGEKVTPGQALGTVFSPPSDSPILHFEIRKEREKLNPTAWVK